MLTKNAAIQLKAGPQDGLSEGQFVAYASVFGNIDSYGDVVVKLARSPMTWRAGRSPATRSRCSSGTT
jgi:uncharacterized protein